ncbi:WSC domain-containing protein 2-like [Mytilus californianus]|uniref:WSC domain-containing protein 2-like n=1 Tax=Mytilus californianus TaxID=6549 RepID=UPI0022452A2C|nr:WSC domain-containing protein 2-like [Mytilus californianus]
MKITLLLLICCVTIANVDAVLNDFMRVGHYKGYIGCFVDDRHRLLRHYGGGHHMTLGKCRHLCKGYKYLGLQFAWQCFCGNHLNYRVYPQSSELQCNMPCSAESHRMCGSGWRNSVYKV